MNKSYLNIILLLTSAILVTPALSTDIEIEYSAIVDEQQTAKHPYPLPLQQFGEKWIKKNKLSGHYTDIKSPQDCDEKKVKRTLKALKKSGILETLKSVDEINRAFNILYDYPDDSLPYVVKWGKAGKAATKYQNTEELEDLFNFLVSLKQYSSETLKFVAKKLEETKANDKCQNINQLTELTLFLIDYDSTLLTGNITWAKKSGILGKCQDTAEVIALLSFLKNYPSYTRLMIAKWIEKSGILDKCHNSHDVINQLIFLQTYQHHRLALATQWMKTLNIWDLCQSPREINQILGTLQNYWYNKLSIVTSWMKDSGAWQLCETPEELNGLLSILGSYPTNKFNLITRWITNSGVIARCKDHPILPDHNSTGIVVNPPTAQNLIKILHMLQGYSDENLKLVIEWMEDNGAITKCKNVECIIELFEKLECYFDSPDQLDQLTTWMRNLGGWDICPDAQAIVELFDMIQYLPKDILDKAADYMQDPDIMGRTQNIQQVQDIIQIVTNYSKEHLAILTNWIKTSGILNQCQNITEIAWVFKTISSVKDLDQLTSWLKNTNLWLSNMNLLDITWLLDSLKQYSLKDLKLTRFWLISKIESYNTYPPREAVKLLRMFAASAEKLDIITYWLEESGLVVCPQFLNEFAEYINVWAPHSIDHIKQIKTWMKQVKASPQEIRTMFQIIKEYSEQQLTEAIKWMTNVISKCREAQDVIGLFDRFSTFSPELLKPSSNDELPFNPDFIMIYAASLAATPENKRLKAILERFVTEDDHHRSSTVESILYFCGEDSQIGQEFIRLALAYDNRYDPNSFLAVHQEMLSKRSDDATHNPRTLRSDLTLNLEITREAAPTKPIWMPVNIWEQLFDQLEKLPAQAKDALNALITPGKKQGEPTNKTDLDRLLELKYDPTLRSMLDPKDSLTIPKNSKIPVHSMKFREVLQKCNMDARQSPPDLSKFIQLLINIRTCPTGKINGIVHSHNFMDHSKELDESKIGETQFKEEITHFFKGELRRLREITLTTVLRNGLGLHTVYDDLRDTSFPHDLYYLKGIIGREIGLHQTDEIPEIDIYGHAVNKTLRNKSKQELLDLFYQYYKVEDVVSRIHILLNNGSIQISGSRDLTLDIINEYLQGDAYDVEEDKYVAGFVLLNNEGKPFGFTPKAAEKLLTIMGILIPQKQ